MTPKASAPQGRLGRVDRLDRDLVWDATVMEPRDHEIAADAPVRRAEDLLAAAAA